MDKIIIFDVYEPNRNKVKINNYQMLRDMFDNYDNKQFKQLCDRYNITKKTVDQSAVVKIAKENGIDNKVIMDYISTNNQFEINLFDLSNELINQLQSRNYKIYLVTDQTPKAFRISANDVGFNLDNIKVYATRKLLFTRYSTTNKLVKYNAILNNTNILPSNVLVIGTSDLEDIKPAKFLNIHAVLCTSRNQLTFENIVNCFNDLDIEEMSQVESDDYKQFVKLKESHEVQSDYVSEVGTFEDLMAAQNDKTKNKGRK